MKKQKNSNTVLVLLIILLIAIITTFSLVGMYAWSKYMSGAENDAEVIVAKWHFEVRPGKIESTQLENFAVTRTDGYTHVDEDKLAPGTHGVIPIEVDTTGTEVIMTYELKIQITDCPTNVKFYKDSNKTQEIVKNRISTGEETVDEIVITRFLSLDYVGDPPHREVDAVHTETIYWDWPYETELDDGTGNLTIAAGDEADLNDAGKQIKMRITATGTQVLDDPRTLGGSSISVGDIISYKSNGTDVKGRVVNRTSNIVEVMPIDADKKAITVGTIALGNNSGYSGYTYEDWVDAAESYMGAIDKLNNAARTGYAGASRSLNAADVNRLVNYTPGNPPTYVFSSSSGGRRRYLVVENTKVMMKNDSSFIDATELEGVDVGSIITIGEQYGGKELLLVQIACSSGENTSAPYYYSNSQLENYFKSGDTIWLATYGLFYYSTDCDYSVRACDSSSMMRMNIIDSIGNSGYFEYKVVPVVPIDLNLLVEFDNATNEWVVLE